MPFEKGKSGNPGGRPKEVIAVRDLARAETEKSIKALAEIRDSKAAPESSRVAASQALLDRGWGRPTQMIGGDEDAPILHRIERVIVDSSPD